MDRAAAATKAADFDAIITDLTVERIHADLALAASRTPSVDLRRKVAELAEENRALRAQIESLEAEFGAAHGRH